MAENSTISSKFLVHKIKKIDFSHNFEHGIFFLFDPLMAHRVSISLETAINTLRICAQGA